MDLLLTTSSAAVRLLPAASRLLARGAAPAVGAAAGAAAGTARAGVRGVDAVVRVARVARAALPGGDGNWRAGGRIHLPLRPAEPERVRRAGGMGHVACRVALALAERPDVVFAYWDQGLARLVVSVTEDALTEQIEDHAAEIAEGQGLTVAGDDPEETTHPADPAGVRAAAAAFGVDVLGITAAVSAYLLRLPPSPRMVTAAVTLMRENPRFRAWLRARLGASRMDLLLACANAAVHGAGQTPTSLVLDGALRACQLAETVARAAAFDAVHDQLCAPERVSVPADQAPRPPLRATPAQVYAAHAAAGSALGAAVTLLVKHDAGEAAEALLSGSPKAARYAPAAFHAVLGTALARTGVLVRDPDRLRRLELAGTLVLHPSALRTADGEADPWTEAVLDAARRARMRVVVVDDPVLEDFAGLADQVVDARRPLDDVVYALRGEEGVVLTVARVRSADDHGVLAGLRGSDIGVALTDRDAAVVWGADVLAVHGLPDVWRMLTAIPAARTVGHRGQTLARSGAALSGLLVAIGESRNGHRSILPGLRHAPVDAAAVAALLSGTRNALGVAVARAPRPHARVHWHDLGPDETVERLERASGSGPTALELATDEARKAVGRVTGLPVFTPARWTWQLGRAVRGELDDPLTPVLAVGSAASAILGSVVDALLVVGALDLNALVGGIQRLRAERALSGLHADQQRKARIAPPEAEAPAGGTRTVDAGKLRPGDVIELKTDDVVPADARLLWQDGLEVDESALTGESLPVQKHIGSTPHAAVADRRCMVFEGTTVVAGSAHAVVVGTGDRTEAARAVHLAARTPPSAGVQARLQELIRKALPLTLAGGAAVTGLALLRGTSVREAVGGGVAVAVAAVPEGLPLVATVAQLAAARRLSRDGVLVRTPRALEALGRMDTLCFDKTGTLTENRLCLVRLSDAEGTVRAVGEAGSAGTLRYAVRACPRVNGGTGRAAHATDEAVLDAAASDPQWTQLSGQPFEAARGYAAAIGREEDGSRFLVVKGAPETVLPGCSDLPGHPYDTAHVLAADGLRVLAVASRRLTDDEREADVLEKPLHALEFTGLLALSDVARETSKALVRGLYDEGVRPVMLTGDHPQTARAIARELGWPADTVVVTGVELAAADRQTRARMLRDAGVVARVAPEQKLQVVEALRDAGRVVGMVGDGANDAAAIRAADIGVGISTRGSAAARNAADIVLTADDLTVLIDAIGEGRSLWHSVADAIAILIGGNAGEVAFGIIGTLVSGTAPLSTRQMLLVNLFTDLFPAMAVAVTPKHGGDGSAERAETASPEDPSGGVLGEPLIRQIRHRALTTALGAVTAWLIGRFTPGTARRSSTMALCGVVGTQLGQTLLDRRDSNLVRVTAVGSAAALFAVIQIPVISHALGCTPLGPVAWAGVAVAIALAVAGQRTLPRLEATVARLLPSGSS